MTKQVITALLGMLLVLTAACSKPQPATHFETQSATPNDQAEIQLTGRVNDAAEILTEAERLALNSKLEKLELETGRQLIIVTVSSLGGETISSYTVALANRWGIGRKDINDGVVLLVAPSERQVRIEVGHGLENILSNELCDKIMEEEIIPYFQRGSYYSGVEAGIDALIEKLKYR